MWVIGDDKQSTVARFSWAIRGLQVPNDRSRSIVAELW
jgi:hypothetical protein